MNNINTTNTYPCPQCQKPTQWQNNPNRPFCSQRCKLIDLGAWASENYRLPADDTSLGHDIDYQPTNLSH